VSPEVARLLAQPLTNAITGGGLTIGLIASLAGVLWSASGGVNGLIEGLNIAYDETDERMFFKKRGLALLLTLGAIIFVSFAVALVAVVPVALDVINLGTFATVIANVLRWPLLAVLAMLALGVIYKVAPDRDNPRFRWVSPGAIVATVLWLIGSGLFSIYVNNFGRYDRTYGALAGVIVLMLWLSVSAFVVLLGAEINSELEAQTRKDTTVGEDRPMGQRQAVKADQLGEPSYEGAQPVTSHAVADGTPNELEELRQDIQEARERLGHRVEALKHKLDVKMRVQEKVAERKQMLRAQGEQLKGKAVDLSQTLRSATPERAQQAAGQAAVMAKKRALPIAVGITTGLGLVLWRLVRRK